MMAKRPKQLAALSPRSKSPLTAFYEQCDDALPRDVDPEGLLHSYRWWMSNNPGDVFDIITEGQLEERVKAAAALGIRTVGHLPGFCTEDCPDHLGWT